MDAGTRAQKQAARYAGYGQLHIVAPSGLVEKVKRVAEADGRSVCNWVRRVLEQELQRQGSAAAK